MVSIAVRKSRAGEVWVLLVTAWPTRPPLVGTGRMVVVGVLRLPGRGGVQKLPSRRVGKAMLSVMEGRSLLSLNSERRTFTTSPWPSSHQSR